MSNRLISTLKTKGTLNKKLKSSTFDIYRMHDRVYFVESGNKSTLLNHPLVYIMGQGGSLNMYSEGRNTVPVRTKYHGSGPVKTAKEARDAAETHYSNYMPRVY